MVSINYNLGGQMAMNGLNQSHQMMQISLERLSTGIRINRAEDDAAGLIVRDRFQAQVNGFTEGIRNIQTAQGMIQVAEQGLNTITQALQQMRALAVRASDDNLNNSDRQNIQDQVRGLLMEINSRAERTTYNGKHLLDGSITEATSERQGSAQIQTNSFLANGNQMVSGVAVTGNAATTYGAVSQGSYEVKLAFDASKRDHPVETQNVTIAGTDASGNAYLNESTAGSSFTTSQTFYDSQGNAHAVNIQFTNTLADTWTYHVTSGSGGTWQSPVDASGTVAFSASDNGQFASLATTPSPSTQSASGSKLTVNIADGSVGGQNVVIDFSKLRENDKSTSVVNSNLTVNGSAGTETSNAGISGTLDQTTVAGTSTTIAGPFTWTDRTGVQHNGISYTLTKTANNTGSSDAADTYNLAINGLVPPTGALNGSNTNTQNVLVTFDTNGNVATINGQVGQSFVANLGDGTASGQNVAIDLSQLKNGAPAALSETNNGAAGAPTTTATMTTANGSNLVSGHGPVTFGLNNIVDRNGMQSVSGASVTFTQVGDTNSWNYAVNAPKTNGFTGGVTGGTGTVSFNEDGTLIGPSSFTATLNDGTAEGQLITFNLGAGPSQLTMGRAANLGGTTSDGSAGTGGLAVDAEIFFSGSGANNTTQPVTVVSDVSAGAKAINLGGISFTINQVSTLDVALTSKSYIKAYTYVSATTADHSLQFQVGADEGDTARVGIAKMDVQTMFRGQDQTGGEYGFASVDLSTQLHAQDLIGQVDDALNFVSAENLNVGQFANNLSRTLDLQRQNQTSISGALSNLNDADMATEATNQSKRMVLVQSGTAMVAQANTTSQFLLQLLR